MQLKPQRHPEYQTSVKDKCGKQVWETSVGDKCRRQVWETGVGDKWETSVNSYDPKHPSGTQVWETRGRRVGDKWKTSIDSYAPGPRVGDRCGRQVGDKC